MKTRPSLRPRATMRRRRCVLLSMTAALAAAGASSPVQAAFPGSNGKIAFQSDREGQFQIYVMDNDGTAQTRLTTTLGLDNDPAWSPDGSAIAFHTDRDGDNEIFAMNADGSGQTPVTVNSVYDVHPSWAPNGARIAFQSARDGQQEIYVTNVNGTGQTRLTTSGGEHPAWSPGGSRIAFSSLRDGNREIYVMNSNGTGQTRLTSNSAEDEFPHWAPDGSRLAFYSDRDGDAEIYTMNPDGSSSTQLTDNAIGDFFPAFSPDGTKIAFQRASGSNAEIYVMNADGSGQTRLTDNTAFDHLPDWQPLAAPRPAAATVKLSPTTATNRVGEQHCVTASVEDAFGKATRDVAVRFSVSGANSAGGRHSTGPRGRAPFCYSGRLVGKDSIAAFADSDATNTQSPGEPGDTASKTYVSAFPPAEGSARRPGGRLPKKTKPPKRPCRDSEATADDEGAEEEVYESHGRISTIYKSQDTMLDTWYGRIPCDWSIGGEVPDEDLDPGVEDELAELDIQETPEQLVTGLGSIGSQTLAAQQSQPLFPSDLGPIGCGSEPKRKCYKRSKPHRLNADLPFGGRDVIFVHGLRTDPILDRLFHGTNLTWPQDASAFYSPSGYWKAGANGYWNEHIVRHILQPTPGNRYLVVAWPTTQRLRFGVHAILSQIAKAMSSGTGVENPVDPTDRKGFCSAGCVVISHSAGGPLTDVAMAIAKRTATNLALRALYGKLEYIPSHVRAHVALHGSFSGSLYATAAVAAGVPIADATGVCKLGVMIVNSWGGNLSGCSGLPAITQSVLVDLVPQVMRSRWGPWINRTPVPTLTVAGGHPSSDGRGASGKFRLIKHVLHRGFDDGVLTADSQCANPNPPRLWPSGYFAQSSLRNRLVYDMGNKTLRARGFYHDQVWDRRVAPGSINPVKDAGYVATGCIPYVSPWGMVQPVAYDRAATSSLERYRRHYSLIQDSADHYYGSTSVSGSLCYEETPRDQTGRTCLGTNSDNGEEVRTVTTHYVYDSGLVNPAFGNQMEEEIKGVRKGKKKKRKWKWLRVYHRLVGWRTLTETDYVYKYVLR